jgi:hypothetical protein
VSRFTIVLLLLLPSVRAWGWNPHGHRVVAAVAYQQLTPAVREKAAALLRPLPEYRVWTRGVRAEDRDLVAFLRASNWADDIREDPHYAEADKHKDWHYINRPFSTDGTPTRPAPVPNVETQIASFRKDLVAVGSTGEVKVYALLWLLHLVGDAHQPLHCAARFDHQLPNGDRGGTLILLSADPKDHLHGFWDRAGGDSGAWQDAVAQAKALPSAPAASISVDEHAWIDEGFAAARRWVYVGPVKAGPGPFTLDAAYLRQAQEIARERLALAGARLARLLAEALK